jgi:hypothetical protein
MWEVSQASTILNFPQVLAGGLPYTKYQAVVFAAQVVFWGKRPDKPENALAIGFSDSLWAFTQRCWDGDMNLRPNVGKVVAHLGEAAANWDGLMPAQGRPEDHASGSQEKSDATEHSEFWILILP